MSENINGPVLAASLDDLKYLVFQGLAGKAPRVNATNNHWEVYDNDTQAWVDTGVEATGAAGDDGYTPVVTASQTTGGVLLTISDGRPGGVVNTYFIRDGAAGADGEDGVSPTVTITEITRGHRVKITDAEHPNGQSFDVMNGFNGNNGTNGVNGLSPYIDPTTRTWWYFDDASGLWVDSHVDPDGYPGPQGPAGTNGTDGTDGYSPVVTITNITGGHRVTITDKTHPTGQSFDVMDGEDGIGADSVVYLGYDSQWDDDPSITIHSSNSSYTTAATIAPALMNTILRNVRFMDDYTFDVYDLVGYDTTSPATLTFASVKNNAIKFCTMTGTSGKPSYSSVPISSDFVLLHMDANGYVYYGTTAITGAQINTLAASRKALFLWDEDNERLYTYTEQGLSAGLPDNTAVFAMPWANGKGCSIRVVNAADNDSTYYDRPTLPLVTAADNGKFLRVANGAWAAQTVPSYQGGSY